MNLSESHSLIQKEDKELYELLECELRRQEDTLDMVASESIQDDVTLTLSGSAFANKTAVGLPGHQRLLGSENIDALEVLAARRACALFGAEHANILPYSGTSANLCAYHGLLSQGDTVLALDPEHGSHASHGRAAHISAQLYRFVHFGVDAQTQLINYDRLAETAAEVKPRLLLIGASSYPRAFDYARLADIAHSVGACFMVDMAHTTGLVAGGAAENPVPYADVVTASCTKTMCSVHTGFILCKKAVADKIDRGVYPGVLASMHPATIAAAAWALERASRPAFADQMQRTVRSAAYLANALRSRGLPLLTGGTDCHLFVIDLRSCACDDAHRVTEILSEMGIWVNTKAIPYDSTPYPRGIRAGVTVAVQRGMGEEAFDRIADLYADAVRFAANGYTEDEMASCRACIRQLCAQYPAHKPE